MPQKQLSLFDLLEEKAAPPPTSPSTLPERLAAPLPKAEGGTRWFDPDNDPETPMIPGEDER